jgi:hypothetical protein
VNLGEQLDELRNNILRDKSDIIAGDSDLLWTDETLLRYIRDAERKFARQTLMIRDGTSAQYCNFTLQADQRDYPLHALVIAVVSARAADQQSDLFRVGHALVQEPRRSTLDYEAIANDTASTGAPTAIYTDETLVYAGNGRVTASVYPLPDAAADGTVVTARVVRLPKGEYTTDCLDRNSEIPEDYQFDVLQWAAYRAKATHDADAGDSGGADKHKAAYDEAVVRALRETRRKIFAGTVIGYGSNGFSWER